MHRSVRFALFGLGLAVAASVQAQSPSRHQFSAQSGLDFDNNPGLAPSGDSGVWFMKLAPRYTYSRQVGTASWSVNAGANIAISSNRAVSDNRQDPSLGFSYAQQSPTGGWGLNASAVQASTRATELEETGLVTLDRTQTTYSLGWTGQKAMTELWTLSGGLDLRDVRYDTLALVENRTFSGNAVLAYALSENESLSLQAANSRFNPGQRGVPGSVRSSTNTSLNVLYRRNVSPTLEWGARWGVVRISGANADTSWVGGASITHTGQRFNAALDAGRNVVSSGLLGGFATNIAVRASAGYAVSETTRLAAALAYTRNVGNSPTRDSATTLSLSATTDLTPFWQLALSLQHRQANRPGAVAGSRADGQSVGLNFIYTHPDW